MKKILLMLVLMVVISLSGSLVFAFTFDDKKSYNELDKKVTFEDGFGLGDKIAEIKLISPLHVEVGLGYQKVAEFEVKGYQDYNDALSKVDFYNKRNSNNKFNRNFDYRVKSYQNIPKFIKECTNKDNITNCESLPDGFDTIEVWNVLSTKDLKENDIYTIGIFTEVKKGDYVEWIPTFYGFEITEWATWSASLNTGLNAYLRLNETSGNPIDATNRTNFNATNITGYAQSGKINNSYNFVKASKTNLNNISSPNISNYPFSFGGWINSNTTSGGQGFIMGIYGDTCGSGGNFRAFSLLKSNSINTLIEFFWTDTDTGTVNITSASVINGSWVHLTVVAYNQSLRQLFINGVGFFNSTNNATFTGSTLPYVFRIGGNCDNGADFTGLIDEVFLYNRTLSSTEVYDIYNSTTGYLTFNPSIALIYPSVNLQTTTNNITFNYSVTDLTGLTNLTLFIDGIVNETNSSGLINGTYLSNKYVNNGNHNWSVGAINSLGFITNSSINNFSVGINVSAFDYPDPASAGDNVTWEIQFNQTDINIDWNINAYLTLNGTRYNGLETQTGTDRSRWRVSLFIPSNLTAVGGRNATWNWTYNISSGSNFNALNNITANQNTTLFSITVDNCSVLSRKIFNFTVLDEELQTKLSNSTIETSLNLYSSDRSLLVTNFSASSTANPYAICINNTLSNSSSYSLDIIVRYEADGYANEYYNIVNQTFTNSTLVQNISLFDLNLNDTTEFQITFIGGDFFPVENALIYLDRQYISENQFKTVELPLTDSQGQTILHMVRSDVIYNIRVLKSGVILGTFTNINAFCEDFTIGNCKITLNAFSTNPPIFNYDNQNGIIFTTPVYNSTLNTISFTFSTPDGSSKNVSVNITRNDIYGNRSVCSNSIISSGGTLSCSIDPNLDDTLLIVNIYVDGVPILLTTVDLEAQDLGVVGYLALFVMAFSLMMMFSGSKTGILIAVLLSFIGAILMGILIGGIIGLGSSGIYLLIIVSLGLWKIHKGRQQ